MYLLINVLLQAQSNDDPPYFGYFIGFVILVVILVLIFSKKVGQIHDNEVSLVVDKQLSAQEFYARLQEIIESENMPNVKFGRVKYNEFHALSALREYFRVSYRDDIFDICVAPFGNGSFVSYWLGEPKKRLKELAQKMAFKAGEKLLEDFERTTRYEIDTRTAFKSIVKDCIKKAIEENTEGQGVRKSPEELATTGKLLGEDDK